MNNNELFEIDIFKLLKVFWRKALVIILIAVVFASASFAYTLFYISPSYDASASFYVNNSSLSVGGTKLTISNSELTASSALVNTYIFTLQSRTTLEDVIAKADLPFGYQTLSGMITITPVEDTAAFTVRVRSSSPTRSEQIANTIAEVLPQRISEIVDGSSVRIVDYAIVPSHRSAPNYLRNTLIGLLAGAVLAMGIIAVRFMISEQNDTVIHSSDELRQLYPDIKVLALIPDMRLSEKKGYYYSSYYGDSKKGAKVSNG